ncbi:hypothetical protein [Nocardia abscessus]|uniref:hypothetical protein n=1 Tax=Nocardia abscessus TaxID=120957 RepID=UPI002457FE51|nr:hypothetical protein [Nocardia abscessus]
MPDRTTRADGRTCDQYGRPIYAAHEIPPEAEAFAVWRGRLTHSGAVTSPAAGTEHQRMCVGGWIASGEWWLHCGHCRPHLL